MYIFVYNLMIFKKTVDLMSTVSVWLFIKLFMV